MKKYNINDMTNGWFVGNFEPSIYKSHSVEVAHQKHDIGIGSDVHFHAKAHEINYIINGKVLVDDKNGIKHIFNTGDIFVIEPKEIFKWIILEKTDIIVIKYPSVKNDKYPVVFPIMDVN